ncbi:hypothetical protein QPM17_20645 [Marinobacter sp. TBZ242]|uniref:Uncharacterized protein n=1 Tax=Marinobacter azerbaijanicus TaxID=3050455 RepID=A0ABT7IHB5_9GAMM|nr:hypothetical protein [Marinobacter sp. TBZ242]MDL0433556.1 hypothetical protein [Marinobacter sp. TBZ242]
MAAPAISTVGSFCAAVLLSSEVMSRPQPESRTAADKVSSPCFAKFLPQYDIVSHQIIDEFERIIQRQFSVICALDPGFAAMNRQKIGAYRGIHVEMERNRIRKAKSPANMLLLNDLS